MRIQLMKIMKAIAKAAKWLVNLLRKMFTWNKETWKRGVTFVVALALLGLGLIIWGAEGRPHRAEHPVFAILGGLLVLVALLRAVYALFGKVPALSTPGPGAVDPNSADGKQRAAQAEKLNYRWRIAWAVGALMVATIAVTAVTFSVSDRIRTGTPFCDDPAAEPPTTSSTSVVPTTTESNPDTTAPTTDTTVPAPSVPEDQGAEKEEFGVERGIRSHTFSVKAATADEAAAITKDDFRVYADDGYSETDFARIESVRPLTNGDAQIRMQIDMSCHSALEGGTQAIITVYHGKAQLEQSRWDLEVSLQSRLVFFALTLVPVIIILAMWQTFAMWPTSLKRWFTSLVAVGIPVLSAFTAAGLRNSTWSPDLLAIGTLIGTAYAAGITAANLVKNGGHDLEEKTTPDPDTSPGAEVAAK